MKRFIVAAASTAVMFGAAHASVFYLTTAGYNQYGTGGNPNGGSANYQEYTKDGVTLTVSAGLYTDPNNTSGAVVTENLYDAEPRVYDQGTGVDHDGNYCGWFCGGNLPDDNDHQVDGDNGNEVVILDFSEDVIITGVQFAFVGGNDDFDLFVDLLDDGSLNRIVQDMDIPGSGFSDLTAYSLMGDLFGFGASGSNDEWKLTAIFFETLPDVPLPAAAPLFAAGLGGMAWLRRRKKAATA